jgi:hypothetical protein
MIGAPRVVIGMTLCMYFVFSGGTDHISRTATSAAIDPPSAQGAALVAHTSPQICVEVQEDETNKRTHDHCHKIAPASASGALC